MLHPFHWCKNRNLHPPWDDLGVFSQNLKSILQWFFGDFFSSPWVSQWRGLSLPHLASRTRKWAFTCSPPPFTRHPTWCRAVSPTRFNSRYWDAANTEAGSAQGSGGPSGIACDPSGNFCSWILQKVYGLDCWLNLGKVEGPNFDGSIWLSHGKVNYKMGERDRKWRSI